MRNPFTENGYLSPEASLNKLRLVSIPWDTGVMPGIRGKTVLELVSGEVFNEQLNGLFAELGIRAYHAHKHRRFIELLGDAQDSGARARGLLRDAGVCLGHILLALKAGIQENRPEWNAEQWAYWRGVERVYLSGGLSYSVLGERIIKAAEGLFQTTGRPYELRLADNSEYLPLIGAYQYAAQAADAGRRPSAGRSSSAGRRPSAGRIILTDFGHTYVKCGYAEDDRLVFLDKIESIVRYLDGEPEDAIAGLLNDFVVGVLQDLCKRQDARPEAVAVSIANYVNNGRIYPYRGAYGRLAQVADNYEEYLSSVLSRRLGWQLRVHLIHDGTAAAYGVDDTGGAPGRRSAVITLGTGLGVGFCDMKSAVYKNFCV